MIQKNIKIKTSFKLIGFIFKIIKKPSKFLNNFEDYTRY